MTALPHLMLRFEGPLQAWGGVALDPKRPTRPFPSLSGIAGLLANALGWRHLDGDRTNALQDSISFAVREDRAPMLLRDFQTVDLAHATSGWTRWGVERRGGAFATGTHILEKDYLADGSFLVALSLTEGLGLSLADLSNALLEPARPLFLGRKSCPPALPVLEGEQVAASPYDAVNAWRFPADTDRLRAWWQQGQGPEEGEVVEVWDRRDFATNRFEGARWIVEGFVYPEQPAPAR